MLIIIVKKPLNLPMVQLRVRPPVIPSYPSHSPLLPNPAFSPPP